MCFNAQASLVALAVGVSGQIVLYRRGGATARGLALALTALTLMQAYETVLWTRPCGYEAKGGSWGAGAHDAWNTWTSRVAMLTNVAQPALLAAALLWATRGERGSAARWTTGAVAAAYVPLVAYGVATTWSRVTCSAPVGVSARGASCTADSCGLDWQWVDDLSWTVWWGYFALMHVAILALLRPAAPTAFATLVAVDATFLLAEGLHARHRSVGSYWCLYAIALPWLLAALPLQDAAPPTLPALTVSPKVRDGEH